MKDFAIVESADIALLIFPVIMTMRQRTMSAQDAMVQVAPAVRRYK